MARPSWQVLSVRRADLHPPSGKYDDTFRMEAGMAPEAQQVSWYLAGAQDPSGGGDPWIRG